MSASSISSGTLTPGTTTIFTGKALLNGVIIQPGATVTIYDNTAASGTPIFVFVNAGTSTAEALFNKSVRCDVGMTVVVAAANAIVYHGAA